MVLPAEPAGPRFFLRGVTPLSLPTLSWLVTGRAWLPNIGSRVVGFVDVKRDNFVHRDD
jgi:hypothetical protein